MGTSTDKHLELAVTISIEALKGLLFVNAGAAASLIALTDKANGGQDYAIPIICFGVGALASVITLVLGYFSQLQYANYMMTHEGGAPSASAHLKHRIFQIVAIVFVLAAMGLAAAGMYGAYNVAKRQQSATSYARPTMAEVFNMRSRCADGGQKILDKNIHGPLVSVEQVSHYNPVTNRCFVELDSVTGGNGYESSQYLYDGQTGEMLAWFTTKRSDAATPERLTCFMLDYAKLNMREEEFGKTSDSRCQAINKKIIELMTDDRTQ